VHRVVHSVKKIHRIVIPPSPHGDGLLIQAQYTSSKNLVEVVKLRVHTIIDDIVGYDVGENLDMISHLFMTKLVQADLNEL